MIQKNNKCLQCNSAVENKFCNVSCQNLYCNPIRATKRINRYYSSPVICLECNEPIDYHKKNNKFCSVKCAHIYRYKNRPIITCDICGILINSEGKCKKCTDEDVMWQFVNNNLLIILSRAKRFMLLINHSCQKCGWNKINEFTGKVPLELHHKDGNRKNNVYNNLDTLCPNCHSLTRNFRFNLKGKYNHKSEDNESN